MNSTRLPGKVMMEAANIPMIGHIVKRLKVVPSINSIIIATTHNKNDDVLVEYAKKVNVEHYRGSEDDVMERVICAAKSNKTDLIVEITGDCPIIDPSIIEQTIRMYLAHNADYVSNAHVRSYPDGMDCQVFKLDTLIRSSKMTNNSLDREHVTRHIRNNPNIFSIVNLVAPPDLHWPELGLTLDEYEDYLLIKKIIEHFNEKNINFSCKDSIEFIKSHRDLLKINQNVKRTTNN